MAWYEDLAPCEYFGPQASTVLRAVGWLSFGKSFPTGITDRAVYTALISFASDPWQPVALGGSQACELCLYETSAHGSKNLFIPASDRIYVSPELVTHYMSAHAYLPPREFCEAVRTCPPMRTMTYRKAILAAGGGVLNRLVAPEAETFEHGPSAIIGLRRVTCQPSQTLSETYQDFASGSNASEWLREAGRMMLSLIPALEELLGGLRVFGMTSHETLCLLAEDDYRSSRLVTIQAVATEGFVVRSLVPENLAPWPGATVEGTAGSVAEAIPVIRRAMTLSGLPAWQ